MVAVDEVLTDSLGSTIRAWFEPSFDHPFLGVQTVSVPDYLKHIPKRWVEDVQIDEGFFRADDGDPLQLGGGGGGGGDSWTIEEGKHRLRDALARLELPEDRVSHVNLDRMNRQELNAEKRRVKQELKRYDAEFRKSFARLPSHTEKEPMRPLYVYYRRLKTMIAQAEQTKFGRRSGAVGGGGSGDEGIALRFGPRESLTTIPDLDETPRAREGQMVTRNFEEQMRALESRIESLQTEKSAVRTKLQTFQEKFVSENNRKIRFHKDILPIEREYRQYKSLKEEIMKAEQQLRDLRPES